jgi:hypothetical protein
MAKEPKDPAFPHPTLEVGVPQYPTPNVPDFYTKSGHIILVERISVDKGSYNPLPLDGSITYTGKDANKFPDDLYLVAERPTADGLFCYRFWANDRTLTSQDPWNYGIDYSANNPSYPIYSRQYITPRYQYAPASLGDTDPVFGGSAIISQQKMVELGDDDPLRSRYVQVQRIYETIPGPIITGKRIDARGDIETVLVQTVAAGTDPATDGLFITEAKVDPIDSVKGTKTTASVASYAALTSYEYKGGLLGLTHVLDNIVSPGTNPDSLSTTVLESSVEQISKTKARKRTISSDGPTLLSGAGESRGLLGTTKIEQSIVSYNSAPDSLSYKIISSTVDPIDKYKSKKTTIISNGPTALQGGKLNNRGELELIIESIINSTDTISADNYTLVSSEIEPIDYAKSKKTDVVIPNYNTLNSGLFDFSAPSSGAKVYVENTIVDPLHYTTPTLGLNIVGYSEKRITPTKLEITKQTVDSFPTLIGSQIDKITGTQHYETEKEIVGIGSLASATLGVINEYLPIDIIHSQRVTTDYSALIGYQWTEYETESYTIPSRLWVYNSNWGTGYWTLNNIYQYTPSRSLYVNATITYTIESTPTIDTCYNIITQTLITDFGMFQDVIHNVIDYRYQGQVITAQASTPNAMSLPMTIVIKSSSTRITQMGGLYLNKKVEIPFSFLF